MTTQAPSASHPRTLSAIEHRPPSSLQPWPNNPRAHTEKQLTKLAASIKQFGFTTPVLIDEMGVILSGHGRVEAAKRLNLKTIPVRSASGWTEADKRAYVIADNKLALLSNWDADLLKGELALLIADEVTIETTGFSTAEVDVIFDDEGASPGDDVLPEEVTEEPTTRVGDMWLLGGHKIICGSAIVDGSYAALLAGERVQMTITDPPYNVPIEGHVSGKGKTTHKEFAMAAGEMTSDQFKSFLAASMERIYDVCEPGAICFVFMDWRHLPELLAAAQPRFKEPRQLICWNKETGGMGTFYRSQHELVYVFKKGDVPHINNFELGQHGRYRTNVWTYPGANNARNRHLLTLHPTVKPAEMIADAIRDCSHRKGIVLDPFAGSGTILVAAERTGRRARAIELDPHYVDVAVLRWQKLTGKQAVLAATGQPWEEVREARLQLAALEGHDDGL